MNPLGLLKWSSHFDKTSLGNEQVPFGHVYTTDAMCLMSAQVCAFLFEAMSLQSGSLSLPENNALRNKAAQHNYQLWRLNEQCRHPPPPHLQCNVCASYLIAAIPRLPTIIFFFPLSFLPCSEKICVAVTEMAALFPKVRRLLAARPITSNPATLLPPGQSGVIFICGTHMSNRNLK